MGNDYQNATQNTAPDDNDDGEDATTFSSALGARLSPDPTWTPRTPSFGKYLYFNDRLREVTSTLPITDVFA